MAKQRFRFAYYNGGEPLSNQYGYFKPDRDTLINTLKILIAVHKIEPIEPAYIYVYDNNNKLLETIEMQI